MRIRNFKEQGKDKNLVVTYIKNFKDFFDLHNLLAFLLDQHFIYLPSFIFDVLVNTIVKIQSETNFTLENSFKESSPLIEILFHWRSLAKLHHANPHAEYFAYGLYQNGISGYANRDYIGMTGTSFSIEIR